MEVAHNEIGGRGAAARFLRLLPTIVLAVSLLSVRSSRAEEAAEILWIHPYTQAGVYDPAHRQDQLEDNVLNWMIDHLGQYRQSVTTATVSRLMALFGTTDAVCYATLKKTPERLSFVAYSDGLFWSLPERLYVLETAMPRLSRHLQADGSVDLAELLADPGLRGLREPGRAFSPLVEAALAGAAPGTRLIAVPKEVDAYAMLANRHVDWLVGHPTEARRHFREEFPALAHRALPIAGADEPFEIFVGCSRKPQGLHIIADIDALLRQNRPRDALQDLYDRWIDAGERADLHRFIAANAQD